MAPVSVQSDPSEYMMALADHVLPELPIFKPPKYVLLSAPVEPFGQTLIKNAFVPLILSMSVEHVSDAKDMSFLIQQFKDANKSVIQDMFMI